MFELLERGGNKSKGRSSKLRSNKFLYMRHGRDFHIENDCSACMFRLYNVLYKGGPSQNALILIRF